MLQLKAGTEKSIFLVLPIYALLEFNHIREKLSSGGEAGGVPLL